MIQMKCTLDSISGCGVQTIQVYKPKLKTINKNNKLENLIDYLIYCDGIEYLYVRPPKDIHKEALKIKALYPILDVEVIHNKIKICL